MSDQSVSSYPLLVHFPAELIEEVDALCRENYMDRSDFIKLALKQMLELYGKQTTALPFSADEEEAVLSAAEDDE